MPSNCFDDLYDWPRTAFGAIIVHLRIPALPQGEKIGVFLHTSRISVEREGRARKIRALVLPRFSLARLFFF